MFKIGFAFNYLQIEHKGSIEYPTDNHYVGLTNEGIRFFALSSFSGIEKTVDAQQCERRYNVYLNGSLGGFNLLDIDTEQLQIVIDAYLEGKPDFAIAGQNYRPQKIHTIKIFENTSHLNGKELKQLGREEGSKRGFIGNFFSDDDLEKFGEELTYKMIGNAQFGSGKKVDQTLAKTTQTIFQASQEADLKGDGLIFISYSWDSKEHEDHVLSFADELRKNGFNVDIDKNISQHKTSTNFNQMMHEAFLNSEHIIVVLSKGYKEKADAFQGGVGVEYRLILGEIDRLPLKYILVSFKGRDQSIIPLGLGGRDVVDLSKNGLEPLFRKLTGQHEYVLSPASKEKPILSVRQIVPFADQQAKLNNDVPIENTVAELTAKHIEKKKQLQKDFAPWLNYKKRDQKKRFRMIIHAAENDTYPDQPLDTKVLPTWFGAEIYGLSNLGIEFCNENKQIFTDAKGNWSSVSQNGLASVNVHVIRTIVYDDIVTWDMHGDGIYNCPHFYVIFNEGTPWKETYYVDQNLKHNRFTSKNMMYNDEL